MLYEINFTLNNEKRSLAVRANETLLEVLRYKLGITSPKSGCEEGSCGTCTVRLNGLIVKSCLVLAVEVDGQEVTTLEGLMSHGLTPLQQSFLNHNAFQCGYCAPGMIMAAEELLRDNPHPGEAEIKEGLGGNLCRCTGYTSIIAAIKGHVSGGGSYEQK
jgi:aerobic-type carbon monoxide dehydrogenase small subunit (CoxS/CutS family)